MPDTPESFAARLILAAAEAMEKTHRAVEKGANNIKRDAQRNVRQSAPIHNANAASAISYDIDGLKAEIGYDRTYKRAGLGSILEYGSRKNAPHRDLGRALDAEEPRFEAQILRIVDDVL